MHSHIRTSQSPTCVIDTGTWVVSTCYTAKLPFHMSATRHSDWTVILKSPFLTASSMVTVTVLQAAINNSDYIITVESLWLAGDSRNGNFTV